MNEFDEFENVRILRTVDYISFLVRKRKSLQFEKHLVEQSNFELDFLGTPQTPINQQKVVKNNERLRTIKSLLYGIEEELKSYDHRNSDQIIKGYN